MTSHGWKDDIIKRKLHDGLKIWILFPCLKNNILRAVLFREILFLLLKIKIMNSRCRIMPFIYHTHICSMKVEIFSKSFLNTRRLTSKYFQLRFRKRLCNFFLLTSTIYFSIYLWFFSCWFLPCKYIYILKKKINIFFTLKHVNL